MRKIKHSNSNGKKYHNNLAYQEQCTAQIAQRKSSDCEWNAEIPPIVHEVLRSPGQPLDEETRDYFEPRFGHDFSNVRVHTDAKAAESARAVNALAYTVGRNVVFGTGQFNLGTIAGKELLAHELGHIKERAADEGVEISRKKCAKDIGSDNVILEHTVSPAVIEKPGDKVQFVAILACSLKGDGFSKIVASGGSTFNRQRFEKGKMKIIREWDGMRLFSKVGTFLVDDGEYFHRLEPLKYAIKEGKDLLTSGPKHDSQIVKVSARTYRGSAKEHFHFSEENVEALSRIVETEMGHESDAAKKAVAWAVRNQMLRLGTNQVIKAARYFSDKSGKIATETTRRMVEEILRKPMSDDITEGAIKWFSPNAQPKEGETCKGVGCDGGLDTFVDEKNKKRKVYTPAFHRHMQYVAIASVHEWRVRFYKLGNPK